MESRFTDALDLLLDDDERSVHAEVKGASEIVRADSGEDPRVRAGAMRADVARRAVSNRACRSRVGERDVVRSAGPILPTHRYAGVHRLGRRRKQARAGHAERVGWAISAAATSGTSGTCSIRSTTTRDNNQEHGTTEQTRICPHPTSRENWTESGRQVSQFNLV